MLEDQESLAVVDVIGPALQNSGDWLMSYVVQQMLESKYDLSIALDTQAQKYLNRIMYGIIRRTPGWLQLRRAKYFLANILPHLIRKNWQMPRYSEISAILDCSGFQYGDSWAKLVKKNRWRLSHYRAVKKKGGKVIFLPQAFGPFSRKEVANTVRDILGCADLIYARDHESYEHVKGLNLDTCDVRMAPDFTVLAEAIKPDNIEFWQNKVCIVPNSRMLDMTQDRIGLRYKKFLNDCITQVLKFELTPVIILHERFDIGLARDILLKRPEIQLIVESPLIAKGILGSSRLVISSRFHACVGGLSQAVPTLGAGWSHKYKKLFEDYGCAENLLVSLPKPNELTEQIARLLDISERKRLISVLEDRTLVMYDRARKMWNEIENEINSGNKSTISACVGENELKKG